MFLCAPKLDPRHYDCIESIVLLLIFPTWYTGQLDQASAQQAQAVREVTRQLDTVENEAARLKDRYMYVS